MRCLDFSTDLINDEAGIYMFYLHAWKIFSNTVSFSILPCSSEYSILSIVFAKTKKKSIEVECQLK